MVVVDLPLGVAGCLPVRRQHDGLGLRRRRRGQIHDPIGYNHLLQTSHQEGEISRVQKGEPERSWGYKVCQSLKNLKVSGKTYFIHWACIRPVGSNAFSVVNAELLPLCTFVCKVGTTRPLVERFSMCFYDNTLNPPTVQMNLQWEKMLKKWGEKSASFGISSMSAYIGNNIGVLTYILRTIIIEDLAIFYEQFRRKCTFFSPLTVYGSLNCVGLSPMGVVHGISQHPPLKNQFIW